MIITVVILDGAKKMAQISIVFFNDRNLFDKKQFSVAIGSRSNVAETKYD